MAAIASVESNTFPCISGYSISEQIYNGRRTAVYRALQLESQRPVIIKTLQTAHPSFSDLAKFRHQFAITNSLSIASIAKPLSLEALGNSYALVMEDVGGISLQQYTRTHTLSLVEVLGIAIQMADILETIFQHHIIHKDIKPANIIIEPKSKRIQLIDFSIASVLSQKTSQKTQSIQTPNGLEGTLAYLSPEQTGRMNRGIDYRTDFYSLGVTLYELLTGTLPFQATDPMELVHCHIAQMPPSPHEVNPDVPAALSNIVLKLMAKNAEDRYQSVLGLKHDLTQCLHQWKETKTVTNFELGEKDANSHFLIPEKLYGRQAEVKALLDAFDRVSQSTSHSVLESGLQSDSPSSEGAAKASNKLEGSSESTAKEFNKSENSSEEALQEVSVEEQSSQAVLNTIPSTKAGHAEIVLVAGLSGTGKTSIIYEVHKPITRQKGYFIGGKFDQFNRNI
ncbi:MAG: protein kinase, partial [Cyanobacteria bacterium J06621_11]